MIIISHRGYWLSPDEKNTPLAFERTIDLRFGTETDVRDRAGELVVSHDPADATALPWNDLIDLFQESGLPLAVNIKSDGLTTLLDAAFAGKQIDWFAFDMSGPEMARYARAGLPFFTRHSDMEPDPIHYNQAEGVWLDSFGPTWFGPEVIEKHLASGKRVCVVSPELHGRDQQELWPMIRSLRHHERLMLCTDFPGLAREWLAS